MAGLGAARAQWNAMLLRHVAADAYVALLEAARRHLGPCPAFAALWPAQVVCACVMISARVFVCVPTHVPIVLPASPSA